jgi:hypothetical protein
MGLNIKEKQAVAREYKARYHTAAEKAKPALLDEFTRLAGCRRKSTVRLLSRKPVWEILIYSKGRRSSLNRRKNGLPTAKAGVSIPMAATALRLIRTFFWYKCGKILAPLMRRQMPYIAAWQPHRRHRRKAQEDKPRGYRPAPQKRQGRPQA